MKKNSTVANSLAFQHAALPHLQKITGQHASKKRNTLLAVAYSQLMGESMDWKEPTVCARSTWYEKWSKDPLMQEVLEGVSASIADQQSILALQAVEQAKLIIQMAAPDAARTMTQLLHSHEETQQRMAAADLLNRASSLTATKADVTVSTITPEQLANAQSEGEGKVADWQPNREEEQP